MAAPLSPDLRWRLVRAVEAGSSAREAARRIEVSASAAIKVVRRVRETGSAAPAKMGGYRKPLLSGHEGLLRELTASKPGITLVEIQAALTERGIRAGSLTTIWSTLRRLGLRHKKSLRAAEQDRPDIAEGRRLWRVWQRSMDPAAFVFLDETGASTNMVRRYGWGPKGERLTDAAPQATGAPPPSSPVFAAPASSPRSCWTGR
jgi:transposase